MTEAGAELEQARVKIANLEIALHSNRRIGIAVGILMSTRQLTDEAAFQVLADHSQATKIKLAVLAEYVIMTGTV